MSLTYSGDLNNILFWYLGHGGLSDGWIVCFQIIIWITSRSQTPFEYSTSKSPVFKFQVFRCLVLESPLYGLLPCLHRVERSRPQGRCTVARFPCQVTRQRRWDRVDHLGWIWLEVAWKNINGQHQTSANTSTWYCYSSKLCRSVNYCVWTYKKLSQTIRYSPDSNTYICFEVKYFDREPSHIRFAYYLT